MSGTGKGEGVAGQEGMTRRGGREWQGEGRKRWYGEREKGEWHGEKVVWRENEGVARRGSVSRCSWYGYGRGGFLRWPL